MRILDGEYVEIRDDAPDIARAITAGGGPLYPPAEWYSDPKLDHVTPMTVTSEGEIYGHIAPWQQEHIGLPPGTKPPRNRSDYQFFKTGVVRLDDGSEAQVGQITLAGGHAPMTADAATAVEHYDNTASAIADVTIGEDAHGIWVRGSLRPDVDETKIRTIRASAVSGDWRPLDGNLELVAICQVNVPGFPVARAIVASGEVSALVAAGASTMYGLQQEEQVFAALRVVEARVRQLEEEYDGLVAAGKIPAKKKSKGDWFDDDKDDDEDKETPSDEAKEDDKASEKDDDKASDKEDPAAAKREALRAKMQKRKGKK